MITITPEAVEKLSEALDARSEPEAAIRVGVTRGPHGCIHGWRLALEDKPGDEDVSVESNEMPLIVEPDLVHAVEGASITYGAGPTGVGFNIEAPNAPPPG